MEDFACILNTTDTLNLYWPLEEFDVQSNYGLIHVAVQGNIKNPAIITIHDLGLNHISCFQEFFSHPSVQPLLEHFCVYHVNVPLQDQNAPTIFKKHSTGFLANLFTTHGEDFPSLDQISHSLVSVLEFFGISHFVGFGVGVGANILLRFALSWPNNVDALYLVNCDIWEPTWLESLMGKYVLWYLKANQSNKVVENSFINYWFGEYTVDNNPELVDFYREIFNLQKFKNLALFYSSYLGRSEIELEKPEIDKRGLGVKCPHVFVTGQFAPLVDRLSLVMENCDPELASVLVLSDCGGMPLLEKPHKILESFILLVQGVGYVPCLSLEKIRSLSFVSENRCAPHEIS